MSAERERKLVDYARVAKSQIQRADWLTDHLIDSIAHCIVVSHIVQILPSV